MDIKTKISHILGQEFSKINSDDRMSDLRRARKEISETDNTEEFPETINKHLFWKRIKVKNKKNRLIANYRGYFRGFIIHDVWVRSNRQLIDIVNNFDISISDYKKLKYEPEKEIEEVTGAASAGGYVGPLFVSPLKKGEMKEELTPPPLTKSDIKKYLKPKVKKQEVDEVTDSSSSGSYETPFFLAKNKKNWRGNKKTQIPGGKFVKVKDKCKTYPYCNQGIGALHLSESSKLHSKIMSHLNETLGVEETEINEFLKKKMRESLFKKRMREMNNTKINKSQLKNKK